MVNFSTPYLIYVIFGVYHSSYSKLPPYRDLWVTGLVLSYKEEVGSFKRVQEEASRTGWDFRWEQDEKSCIESRERLEVHLR